MIGKKNIVFGFFYLVLTAALGPVMIVKYYGDIGAAESTKQQKLGALQQAQANNFEVDLEKMTAEQIAQANTSAILALSSALNSVKPVDAIKGGPHAHGNLEAMLNILVGILLGFLAVPVMFKQVISWVFIGGAVLHSGLLYLAVGLELPFAAGLLGSWFSYIGPVLVLLGLFLAGVATLQGYKGAVVKDKH
jgi:hypothetical protein